MTRADAYEEGYQVGSFHKMALGYERAMAASLKGPMQFENSVREFYLGDPVVRDYIRPLEKGPSKARFSIRCPMGDV